MTESDTPETKQCSICLAHPPYGDCAGDESCAYILTLERRLAQSQARVAELEKDADRLRRIRLAHKSGVVLSGDGTGYLNVLLEMDREDALKDRA